MFYPFTNYSIYSNMDVNAKLFIDNVGLTNFTHKIDINNLVLNLKTNNLWNKFVAIYPLIGGTATTHKYNLKDPQDLDASFRLVFSGGITHDSNGVTGNGTNGYARTNVIPSTHLSLNNSSGFVYSRTNTAGAYVDLGSIKSGAPQDRFQINGRNASNNFTSACNDTTLSSVASSNSNGFIGISRTASGNYFQNRNTTQSNVSVTSTALNAVELYFMAVNSGGPANYSPRNYAFACIGEGLTASQTNILYNIVQIYQTKLNRNV